MTDEELLAMVRCPQSQKYGWSGQRSATKRMRRMLLDEHGIKRCCYCKKILTELTATIEHLTPLCEGGRTERRNCKLACFECNQNADQLRRMDNATNDVSGS